MPPGAPPLRVRAIRVVLIAVVLQALFVFFFVVPAHDPEPNGLPIAVAGPAAAVEGLAGRIAERADVDVRRVASAAEGRRLVLDREVYGVLVLGGRGVREVVTASAASLPASQLVAGVGRSLGAQRVTDVKPLARADPRGITLNVLVLPLVITAILAALAAVNIVPDLDVRGRFGLTALAGALGGLVAVALVNWWRDALPGPWLAEAGVIALAVLAIALTSAGIIRLIGPAGTAVPFLLFLMLGNPASGVASAPELLPTPWAEAGPFLPPGALGSALRGTAYFDGAGVLGPLFVLLAWAALGLALVALSSRRTATPPAAGASH